MIETILMVAALGMLVTGGAAVAYGVVWAVLATPLVRWCLIAVVVLLALRVLLLPVSHLRARWGSEPEPEMSEEELRSKTDILLTTQIVPTRRSSRFSLSVQGSLTNNSDRVIDGVVIWCRAAKLFFGDSETATKNLLVTVRPGETKSFSSVIAEDLTGVTKVGFSGLQPPDQRFCRVTHVSAHS